MSDIKAHDESSNSRQPAGLCKITRARLAHESPESLWDISIDGARVSSIERSSPDAGDGPHHSKVLDADGRFLAPSLCHAHVHLDKCFLLQDDKYRDLEIVNGDFAEALSLTNRAKERFDQNDLLRRGRRLIDESIKAGVTAMRAFVEVDEIVQLNCLNAARELKAEYNGICHIQVCAFAQLPVYSHGETGNIRRKLMENALVDGVDVVGSTPYVEDDLQRMRNNVDWAISLAIEHKLNLDFHLDYNLDPKSEPLIWYVVEQLHKRGWMEHAGKSKTICVGHCTRLTLLEDSDWCTLRLKIGTLPLHFVGLPMSDLFMMGRTDVSVGRRARGTLPILDMVQQYALNGCIAINNIGNAFTPSGNCDPLSLASFGVSIYQGGTKNDCEKLYEMISNRAMAAINLTSKASSTIETGSSADFCLYGPLSNSLTSPKSIAELIYYPPTRRLLVHGGRLLSQ